MSGRGDARATATSAKRWWRRLLGGDLHLTSRGWAFLVGGAIALVAAYAGGRPELLYVALLLLALPLLAVGFVRVRRPKFEVLRNFAPGIVQAGASTSVRVSVRNRAATPSTRVRWSDRLPWAPWATDERELPSIRPTAWPTELNYELRPPRRGVFGVGPFDVALGDPFRLAGSRLSFGAEQQLIVTPEVVALAESGLSVPAGSGEARLVQRRAAGDEDDSMTREYRPGDAMRRVHWRATARHDELMVRQEEQRSLPRARILVDTLFDGYHDADDEQSESFEWVVRMLASVAVHLRRVGFAVTIDESGDPQLHVERRRSWGDEEFLAELAALDLVDHRRDTRRDSRDDGPLIALMGDPDAETVEWMLRQRRPGTLAVAFLARGLTSVDRIDRSFGTRAAPGAAGERLLDEGWLVVPVRADDDHAAAWSAVVVETGRARGA